MPSPESSTGSQKHSRSGSPVVDGSNDRKRRRKVLSCYDCRRRKLHCDRALPACGRCVKAGQASNCLYLEDASEITARANQEANESGSSISQPTVHGNPSSVTGASLRSRLEYQDDRIKKLEHLLLQTSRSNGNVISDEQLLKSCICPPSPDSEVDPNEKGESGQDDAAPIMQGGSFKTQFHGPTHPGALLSHIAELHRFTIGILRDYPTLTRVRQEMRRFENPAKESVVRTVSDDELRSMIPPKPETDHLVQLYLDNYGVIYHVLHLPSFWKCYEDLWTDLLNYDVHFVALVLLITAAAQCLSDKQPQVYSANSSLARQKADAAILAVENWLGVQSQKHVTATDFQIRVLLVIAKQASARKFKRSWNDVGNILRFCMSAGLHRDPDIIRKPTSFLNRELRRRIWAAITELELQISFDRGMISAPWLMQSDCPAPSNIPDNEMDQSTRPIPSYEIEKFTHASFLAVAGQSIKIRIEVNTYMNTVRQKMSFEDVKRYVEALETQLHRIPPWTDDAASHIPRAVLLLNLRQYILVLNEQFFRQASSKIERDYSTFSLIEQAGQIMEIHKSLTDQGRYAVELLRVDQLRAALAVCHMASIADPQADASLRCAVDEAAQRIVPPTIEMLTDKIIRFGREQRQLWILLTANGYMRCKHDPSRHRIHMQETVEMLTRPYYKIMACQQNGPLAATYGREGRGMPGRSDGAGAVAAEEMQDPSAATIDLDAALMNVNDVAGWTFDDWLFDPAQLVYAFDDQAWDPSLGI